MSKSYDVTAIGSAIVDVIATVDDRFLLEHGIAKGVMTLVDEHRAQTLHKALARAREIAGGSAANTMAGLASLGAKGTFLGKVKRDRLGEVFAAGMSELGLRYNTKMSEGGPSTGCCLISVTPEGERSMNTYLGTNLEFSVDDVIESDITSAAILYIEGYLWDAPLAKQACLKAIDIAKRTGTKVAITMSDPFLAARYRGEFVSMLGAGAFDILFANEEEVKSLYEVDSFDEVLQRVSHWGRIGALTRSEKGCVIVRGGEVHVIDAQPVKRVVDTTGAGDQFAAGFLFGLVRNKPLDQCGKLGSIAAAEVISHLGARPETSLKTLAARTGLA